MLTRAVSSFSLPASCATEDGLELTLRNNDDLELELPSDVESECLLPSDVEDEDDIMQDLCSSTDNVRRKLAFSSDSLGSETCFSVW